jgi:hypothetical protein
MTARATTVNFPIGCTVRVIGPFTGQMWWMQKYVGHTGTVHSIYPRKGSGWVNVSFGPIGATADIVVRPWCLERVRVQRIFNDF